jgi:HD-GYP domain-containing protein (c-di-GMP phosphodiesterase class II)
MHMDAIIQVMESTIAARDLYTVAHQQRTAHLADLIAAEMDLPAQSRRDLHVAGRLHDLGKIGVPGDILSKHGKLNYFEFALIKFHPQMACDILRPLAITNVIQIILQHHERLDGSGYPLGLRGSEILPEARILAVADVVDAICSDRPYRPSLGMDQALEEITSFKGTLYEAAVVDACMQVYEEWNAVISLKGSLSSGPHFDS